MKINIKGNDLDLHYSMRAYIIYENIMGTSIGFKNDLQSYTAAITLFYSFIVASLQYHKRDSNLSYDEFMDWLDEQEITVLHDFTEWFMSYLNAQSDKINAELAKADDVQGKGKKGGKKKN